MAGINYGRVVLGGLVAGVIINVVEWVLNGVVYGDAWREVMTSLGRPELGMDAIVWFNVIGFVLGFSMLWIYAAIRPRFGAGVKTAAVAGAFVWLVGYLIPGVYLEIMGIYPMTMMLVMVAVGLVEAVVATIAGAYFYTEASA